ncbi:hypothetical protein [Pseudomonas chlororaphis]|uniref:hypothetical protein n=1 Tax=Pseudomonas chlororaphis TaxID=587753 RepID=UPI000AECB305|nr:hypothetical protein [Pseudomonas chlororaphis]
MSLETVDKHELDSSGVPLVNDPGNEDPGSLMDDALVPLSDDDEADEPHKPSA